MVSWAWVGSGLGVCVCGLTPDLKSLIPPGQSLQETITSLKAEVEDHRQELLAGERPCSPKAYGRVCMGEASWC